MRLVLIPSSPPNTPRQDERARGHQFAEAKRNHGKGRPSAPGGNGAEDDPEKQTGKATHKRDQQYRNG